MQSSAWQSTGTPPRSTRGPSDALNLAARTGAPIFVEESLLEQSALPGEPASELDAAFEEEGEELPPGEWRSLSAELLRSLYRLP
jgi:bifunctional DNase/RNase